MTMIAESGRQYVPPSKAVLNVLSNPGKQKHPSSSFMDQRSQSDTDVAVSVCIMLLHSYCFTHVVRIFNPLMVG